MLRCFINIMCYYSGIKGCRKQSDKKTQAVILPSPQTKLECYREYLKRAKQALEEAGGHYEPTEEELREFPETDNSDTDELSEDGEIEW